MNLDTFPAHQTTCKGELNLLAAKYFPNEDRRTFNIEVVHGPKYKTDCNSCQAGVTYISKAFDYLNSGTIIWNKNIIEQTQDQVLVEIGPYRRTIKLGSEKACVVPVEPTLENLLNWFVKQFQGQLELAHTNIITMCSEDESLSLTLGY